MEQLANQFLELVESTLGPFRLPILAPRLQIRRPVRHEPPPPLDHRAARVGGLGRVGDHVCQRRLGQFARLATVPAPRPRARSKPAIAQGHRGDNPAGDAIGAALPKHNGRKRHYRALPHAEVSHAIIQVRGGGSWIGIRLAFEYLVLTAARTAEVRLATWDEIDLGNATWTVPASRMKAGKQHRVPLADRATAILQEAADLFGAEGLLFPGPRGQVIHSASIYSMLRRQGIQTTLQPTSSPRRFSGGRASQSLAFWSRGGPSSERPSRRWL